MDETGEQPRARGWWVRQLTTRQRDAILAAIDAKEGLMVQWRGDEPSYHRARHMGDMERDVALKAVRWALAHRVELLPVGRRTLHEVEDVLVSDYQYQYEAREGVEMALLSERQLTRLLLSAADYFRLIARCGEAKEQSPDTEHVAQEMDGLREYLMLRRSEGVEA